MDGVTKRRRDDGEKCGVETAEGRIGLQTEASTLSPPTVHLQGNTVVTSRVWVCVIICVIVCECWPIQEKNYDCYEVGCGWNWFLALLTRQWLGARDSWIWWSELCPKCTHTHMPASQYTDFNTHTHIHLFAGVQKVFHFQTCKWNLQYVKVSIQFGKKTLTIAVTPPSTPVTTSIMQKAPFPLVIQQIHTHTHRLTHTQSNRLDKNPASRSTWFTFWSDKKSCY